MRRLGPAAVLAATVALAVLSCAAGTSWVDRTRTTGIQISSPQDLPADVMAEIERSVGALNEAVGSLADRCDPSVTLVLVPDVPNGDARYLSSTQRIEIEIPTSPARFRDSLVHELAHHLDSNCEDAPHLREAWLAEAAVGQTWNSGEWNERPSEQFAEAVVEVVLGERVRFGRTMPLPAFADDLVRRWLATRGD